MAALQRAAAPLMQRQSAPAAHRRPLRPARLSVLAAAASPSPVPSPSATRDRSTAMMKWLQASCTRESPGNLAGVARCRSLPPPPPATARSATATLTLCLRHACAHPPATACHPLSTEQDSHAPAQRVKLATVEREGREVDVTVAAEPLQPGDVALSIPEHLIVTLVRPRRTLGRQALRLWVLAALRPPLPELALPPPLPLCSRHEVCFCTCGLAAPPGPGAGGHHAR